MSHKQEKKQYFSPIKQRILRYLETKGITPYRYYLDTGVARGVLNPDTGISEETLAIFLQYAPDVSLEWLIQGKGEMLGKEASGDRPSTDETDNNPKVLYSAGVVPRKAGDINGEYAIKDNPDGIIPTVPVYDLKHHGTLSRLFDTPQSELIPDNHTFVPDMNRCDGALYVRGEGMPPLYQNGDIVLYKKMKNPKELLHGETYLISLEMNGEEHLTIRRIFKGNNSETLLLTGGNSKTDTQEILLSRIKALALIKASIRYNTMD